MSPWELLKHLAIGFGLLVLAYAIWLVVFVGFLKVMV